MSPFATTAAVGFVIEAWSGTNAKYPRTTPQMMADPSLGGQSSLIANQLADFMRRVMIPSDPPWTIGRKGHS